MRYLLLIAEEPPAGQPTQAEIVATMGDYNAFGSWLRERGWNEGGEALQDVTDGDDRQRPRRAADRDRRAVRRDQGAPRRVLPDRRAEPRRRDRGRVADPGRADGQGRGPPDPGDAADAIPATPSPASSARSTGARSPR